MTLDPSCNGEGIRMDPHGKREVSCSDCDGTGQIREGGVEIPAGMMLVPIEPTEAMLNAVKNEFPRSATFVFPKLWSAMLAAYTPTPSPEIAEQPMGDAREALEPFAREAENYDFGDTMGEPDLKGSPDASSLNEVTDLTVGDLRRARSVLAALVIDGNQESSGRPELTGQEPGSTETTTRLRCDSDPDGRADTAEQALAPAGCDGPEDTHEPTPTNPFTTARNDIAGLPGHGMSADVQVAEQRVGEEDGPEIVLSNLIALARPYFRDDVQRLALRQAEDLLAALATNAPDPTSVAVERITDSVVERVAEAIHCSVWDETDLPREGTIERAFAIQHARAALAALATNAPDAAKREGGE